MRVTLIAVQSLDGFITRHDAPGVGFASPEDQAHFRAALRGFESSVMGRATYDQLRAAGGAAAAGRRRVVLTRAPGRFAAAETPGLLEFTAAPPAEIVTRLRREGCRSCSLLGGAQIYSLFLAAGLVDELWLTVEARLFGGGTPLLAAPTDTRLRLLSHAALGENTLLLKHAVER
jgi:dihydrofolate reductase